MSPRRRVLLSALSPAILIISAFAAPAHAQFYDVARSSLGFSLDGIERSPRLLGMGRMTFVGDDPHTAITLWDFAASPLGILEADSANTVEIYPATSSYSSVHDLPRGASTLERQDQAARESRMGYEMWRRSNGRAAYGFTGDIGFLRMDQAYGEDAERRSAFTQPTIMPVLMGHLPYVKSNRWLCSARMLYSGETTKDEYHGMAVTSEGEYIDQTALKLGEPEYFTPTDYKVRSLGGGLGLAYDRGRAVKAAVSYDYVQNVIKGTSEEARHASQIDEKRPYGTAQGTLVGHLGRSLEWGVDGRDWRSTSEQHWIFSVSAGTGADALLGRGKLLDRDEHGQALRSRLRWKHGPFELGAGLATSYRRITTTPPVPGDLTSFNYFLDTIEQRVGADTLALPDSVLYNQYEERTWEAGGGVAMRLPGDRGSWGVEYHRLRGLTEQTLSGSGPLWKGWDLRTGLEYHCTQVLTGRVGYMYRWEDRDDYTLQNEYLGHTMTLGLGVRPAGAFWTLEAGYAVEWLQADYGSPIRPRASRQQLAAMMRWAF